jgi:hypothetical protein
MRRTCLFLSLFPSLFLCLACSSHREAGTGDIAQLLRGPGVLWHHTGTLLGTRQIAGPFVLDFSIGHKLSPAVSHQRLPECPFAGLGKTLPGLQGH